MSRRGARPIEEGLRYLLAIVDALSREDAIVDAKGVSYLLGITREEATEAIDDVLEAAMGADASTGVIWPMEGDAEQGIRLMAGSKPPRALRMTRAEAQALVETLDILGVDDEALGGIRPKIERALFPKGLRPSPVKERATSELTSRLFTCLDALYCNRGVAFDYLGDRGVSERRLVEPLSLRYLFGHWVLDALDLDDARGGRDADPDPPARGDGSLPDDGSTRGGGPARGVASSQSDASVREGEGDVLDRRRFFLVDRIRDAASVPLPRTHVELRNLPWYEGGRWVRLYFTDRSRYDRNPEWTWSLEVARSALTAKERRRITRSGCAVDVRYFPGSPYLARLVVSCAGTCTTDDPTLRADIETYLASLP